MSPVHIKKENLKRGNTMRDEHLTRAIIYKILTFLFIAELFLPISPECRAKDSERESESKAVENLVKAKILESTPLVLGKKISTNVELISNEDNKPVLPSELNLDHTKMIHVLIFDETLADYQHVHPVPTNKPGVYTFEWTPRKKSQYKAWISFIPLETGQEEFMVVDLGSLSKNPQKVVKATNLTSTVDGIHFTLSLDSPEIIKGKPTSGKIFITDEKGNPFSQLEPLLGSFLHIVALNEDFKSISHIWPEGSENADRGVPEFRFRMDFYKPGFWKIWGYAKIRGKEVAIPFGVHVK